MVPENQCELGSIAVNAHAHQHFEPLWSHVLYLGFVGLLLFCLVRTIIHRARELRLAREADAAEADDAPLVTGGRFVSGQVEFAEGSTNAVSVHVEQAGGEYDATKGGWRHKWDETQRQVLANPFYIRRPNGDRVRVDPGENPLLIDELDNIVWKSKTARTRSAALTPHEHVIVEGELTRGQDPEYQPSGDYRATNQGWIMKPIHGKRMLVCTEKLGKRHRLRVDLFTLSIKWSIAALVCMMMLFAPYEIRLFAGTDTCAKVTQQGIDKKRREVELEVAAPGQPRFSEELASSDYYDARIGSILAVRYVPLLKLASSTGHGSSIYFLSLFYALLIGVPIILVNLLTGDSDAQRWYEQRLDDRGSGRLPDPPAEK
jgi:hypothetical protein